MDDSKGLSASSNLYAIYRHNAETRGYLFNISKEFFLRKTKENCFYFGRTPDRLHKNHNNGSIYYYNYNGIDRVDNSTGYKEENCVACCSTCNKAKATMSQDEFLGFIKRVYDYSLK